MIQTKRSKRWLIASSLSAFLMLFGSYHVNAQEVREPVDGRIEDGTHELSDEEAQVSEAILTDLARSISNFGDSVFTSYGKTPRIMQRASQATLVTIAETLTVVQTYNPLPTPSDDPILPGEQTKSYHPCEPLNKTNHHVELFTAMAKDVAEDSEIGIIWNAYDGLEASYLIFQDWMTAFKDSSLGRENPR